MRASHGECYWLGNNTERIFPDDQCPERVTIRVLPGKRHIYPAFKELVTQKIGSDVCFVTMSLWEAFLTAMNQAPPAQPDQLEIKFLRQNVQINIGCEIFYQPGKARRTPGTFPRMEVNKNRFFPLLLEEWETLTEVQKLFWRERLIDAGIIPPESPPSVSTGKNKTKTKIKKILKRMENSMTFVTGWLKRLLGK